MSINVKQKLLLITTPAAKGQYYNVQRSVPPSFSLAFYPRWLKRLVYHCKPLTITLFEKTLSSISSKVEIVTFVR